MKTEDAIRRILEAKADVRSARNSVAVLERFILTEYAPNKSDALVRSLGNVRNARDSLRKAFYELFAATASLRKYGFETKEAAPQNQATPLPDERVRGES